jgi:F0F1-type ATP synthase epsilon subunit
VLVDEVFEVSQLDPNELRDRLQRAQDALSEAEEGSEEARQADRERRRNEAFLRIAEAG